MLLKFIGLLLIVDFFITEVSCSTRLTPSDFNYISLFRKFRIDYPVRFAYINQINTWWPPNATLAEMGVPTYAANHSFNYMALTFWTCKDGPKNTAKLWSDPITYFGTQLGNDTQSIQQFLKYKYRTKGISLLVSAFGASQNPTSLGLDPVQCALSLGNYVKNNNLDGVDIDYEDNDAMSNGTGQEWVIQFTTTLRSVLPFHLITHAPQAPYWNQDIYSNGGYTQIHKKVGYSIDFYNIQYYNQMNATYSTYQEIFINSGDIVSNTSISEIIKKGVPKEMLVVGKPMKPQNAYNTGFVPFQNLVTYFYQACIMLKWSTGVMFWEYGGNLNGTIINQISDNIKFARTFYCPF